MSRIDDEFTILTLGLDALTVDFGNVISEAVSDRVLSLERAINAAPFEGFIETVPAFSSLTVYFDPLRSDQRSGASALVRGHLESLARQVAAMPAEHETHVIAVDFRDAPDLSEMSERLGIGPTEIVSIFTEREYRVYMLGFLPGFAYMGEVDTRIAMPRKATPRTRVARGSVGIAGRQTGIYPVDSPGGWQIIGRTEAKLFERDREPSVLFKPGDRVRFVPV
jgi:inhibitor of KinA